MYHSSFYDMLYQKNALEEWRRILSTPEPDLHMKDVEILLRGFAMLIDGDNYAPSMVKFLNQFSRKCRSHTEEQNDYLSALLDSFFHACAQLPGYAFLNKKNRRFNVALYEAAFAATCRSAFREKRLINWSVSAEHLSELADDEQFLNATSEGTTQTKNVEVRLGRARAILGAS
jgi:hypothetical protein